MPAVVSKYKIKVVFLSSPRTGALCQLKEMTLKTKPVTEKRARFLAEREADSVWPFWEFTLQKIGKVKKKKGHK